ncbi:5-formyltetrahydrofolate cyclo-ligase [Actinacidiphila yeochonensis]|uniref:5-formyltetrahydrofolate cyclo-ligase n=1 Tax=Actinacidiphila yeochonensis TaxID=89050 RepID=UPI00056CB87A|nr:5-formyltetrahydrofolate cyclo-ligase [Actinacidiphila yeochonensis]
MEGIRAKKRQLRSGLLEARRGLTAAERQVAADALAGIVRELPSVRNGGTVAAYVSMGSEPGTHELIRALHRRGTRVLLPVLLPDNDLDWAPYEGQDTLAPTPRGLLEPVSHRLGPESVLQADTILLPGLAVDARGVRLGRGGGSYDRVLSRLDRSDARPQLVVLLYAHEVVDAVPREPHDHLVDAAVTPSGIRRFARSRRVAKE